MVHEGGQEFAARGARSRLRACFDSPVHCSSNTLPHHQTCSFLLHSTRDTHPFKLQCCTPSSPIRDSVLAEEMVAKWVPYGTDTSSSDTAPALPCPPLPRSRCPAPLLPSMSECCPFLFGIMQDKRPPRRCWQPPLDNKRVPCIMKRPALLTVENISTARKRPGMAGRRGDAASLFLALSVLWYCNTFNAELF